MSFIDQLIGRIDGPMSFRVYLQPLVAAVFAFRDGRRDSRVGRTGYLWALFSDPEQRRYLLKDGWKGVGKVFVVTWVLDIVYQLMVLHGVHAGQALATAIILAIIPYVLLRGAVNRLTPKGPRVG